MVSGTHEGDDMTEEHRIMNEIRIALSSADCPCFRINVGCGFTPDGRHFETGVPAGFSDLFGFRNSDGRAFFIEVKTETGRVSPKQKHFIEAMRSYGAIAGICRSADEALLLIKGDM